MTPQALYNHFRGVKEYGFPVEKGDLVAARSTLLNTTMIAEGRPEGVLYERSESTASRFWVILDELLLMISIFCVGAWPES